MKFIVRIGINRTFSANMWYGSGISPAAELVAALGKFVTEDCGKTCVLHAVICVKADNMDEASKKIRSVWTTLYPGFESALSLMIIEDTEDAVSEVMKVIYGVYYGFDEYLKLCTEIARAFPLIKNTKTAPAFLNMSYLVSMDSGCGFTTMTSSFADFIEKCGVFSKPDGSYYEYKIGKNDIDYSWVGVLNEIDDENHKFHVIGIDISCFLDKTLHDEFRHFMSEVSKITKDYIFLFRVPYLDEKALKEFSDIINDYMSLRTLAVKPYTEIELYTFAFSYFAELGMHMDNNLAGVFTERIMKEKQDGRFYGFKTAQKICNELIWTKLQSDALHKLKKEDYRINVINAADVSRIDQNDSKKTTGFEELSKLVGMEDIAKRIEEIIAQAQFAKSNAKMDSPSLHMRFVGPPGTGKTTVARIVGSILKEKGILSKGGFFEYSSRSLVGEYVGQTAPRTHQICQEAYGSVLFIDEAYGLYTGDSEKDYGKEALTTLIAEMENHREDLVVIMAGYTDEMAKLMEGNPGLRSRMPYIIEFNSYSREQLGDIFMSMASKAFALEDGFEEMVREYFNKLSDGYLSSKEFANARFVRNLYERTWAKAALRASDDFSREKVLKKVDFELASQEKEFSEKLLTEKRIGFR